MSSLFGIGSNGAAASFYNDVATQSARFDGDGALVVSHGSAPTLATKGTVSFWFKPHDNSDRNYVITTSGANNNNTTMDIRVAGSNSNDGIHIGQYGRTPYSNSVNRAQRDFNNWYHFSMSFDSTSGTASDRQVKVYLNGVQITDGTFGAISQNDLFPLTQQTHNIFIGKHSTVSYWLSAYLAEFNVIDGQALDCTSFGEFNNGVWIPKEYSGTYGNNGFRLEFKGTGTSQDASGIGADTSGNGNHFAIHSSTLSAHDGNLPDSPENNFSTFNKLYKDVDSHPTFSEGNLRIDATSSSWFNTTSTFSVSSGKWYAEFHITSNSTSFVSIASQASTSTYLGSDANAYGYHSASGSIYNAGSATSYGNSYTTGDIIGVALDLDNGNLYFYKNGTVQNSGTPAVTGLTGTWFMGVSSSATTGEIRANFGQDGTFANVPGSASDTGFDYSAYVASTQFRVNGGWNNAGGAPASGMPAVNSTIRFTNTSGQSVGSSQGGTDFTVTAITQQSGGSSNAIVTVNRSTLPQVVQPSLDTGSDILSVTAISGSNADEEGFGAFVYTPRSGHLALCSSNLPEPSLSANAVEQPDDYFNTVLYSGTGSTRSVTGVGFQPDFIWIKRRNGAANYALYDTTRGGTNALRSNVATHEAQYGDAVITFQSDGFQVAGTNVAGVNGSGETLAAWNWKLNGATTVTNNDGSVASTVQASPTSGISIVTFPADNTDGRTVGHGLGVAPKLILTKNRANPGYGSAWIIYSEPASAGHYMFFTTVARAANTAIFGNTAPTSTVFSIGNATAGYGTNGANDVIAYCFADVEGYQKIGTYNGNSGAGTFIYTGFRPQFFMVKNTTTGNTNWLVFDDVRDTTNPIEQELNWNNNNQENNNSRDIDFCSNGVKLRTSDNNNISSGDTFLYLAIARQPFKYSNAF